MKRFLLIFFTLAFISTTGYSSVNERSSIQTTGYAQASFKKVSNSVKPKKKKSGKPELRKPKQKPRHKREKGTPIIF